MADKYLNEVGTFNCVVEEPEAGWFGESSEKATPFIRIPLRVTDHGMYRDAVIVYNAWLSNAAFDRTISRLKEVFGFDGDLGALHAGRVTLAGLPCSIETEAEDYNGKTRYKVKWLNLPGGVGIKKMDEAKVDGLLRSLTSRAKAVAKSIKAGAAAGTVPAHAQSFEPPTGELPPFESLPATATAPAPAAEKPLQGTIAEDDVPF